MTFVRTMVVVMSVAAVAAVRAADPSGTWRAEFQGPGGTAGVEILKLAVKDTVVTGTFENAVGGVGTLRDGKWDGTTLSFWLPWDRDDKDRLSATGTMTGTTLTLTLKTSQWTARRIFKRQ